MNSKAKEIMFLLVAKQVTWPDKQPEKDVSDFQVAIYMGI